MTRHTFNYSIGNNRTFVRRLQTQNEHPFNFIPRVHGAGGCVSVSGCIYSGARGPFVTYSVKVDG